MPENENVDLKWQVDRHDAELDELQNRTRELQNDLQIVIRFGLGGIVEQARQEADRPEPSQWSGAQPPDPEFQNECRRFAEKYGSILKGRD